MSSSRLKALWHMQNGECFYCGTSTWLMGGGESKNAAKARLGITATKDLRRRGASIEHLHRRADGGSDAMSNFVMACVGCNGARLTTPVLLHLSTMRQIHR